MRIRLGHAADDIKVETKDGEDFLAVLMRSGLYLKSMELHDVKADGAPYLIFNVFPKDFGDIDVDIPDDVCEIRVVDHRANIN